MNRLAKHYISKHLMVMLQPNVKEFITCSLSEVETRIAYVNEKQLTHLKIVVKKMRPLGKTSDLK